MIRALSFVCGAVRGSRREKRAGQRGVVRVGQYGRGIPRLRMCLRGADPTGDLPVRPCNNGGLKSCRRSFAAQVVTSSIICGRKAHKAPAVVLVSTKHSNQPTSRPAEKSTSHGLAEADGELVGQLAQFESAPSRLLHGRLRWPAVRASPTSSHNGKYDWLTGNFWLSGNALHVGKSRSSRVDRCFDGSQTSCSESPTMI